MLIAIIVRSKKGGVTIFSIGWVVESPITITVICTQIFKTPIALSSFHDPKVIATFHLSLSEISRVDNYQNQIGVSARMLFGTDAHVV